MVQNFWKDAENYGKKFSNRGNPTLRSRDRRRLLLQACKSGSNSSKLREVLDLVEAYTEASKNFAALPTEKDAKFSQVDSTPLKEQNQLCDVGLASEREMTNGNFSR